MNSMTKQNFDSSGEAIISKDIAEDKVLGEFLPEKCGSLDRAFTSAILYRNELNHLGHSSANCEGSRRSMEQGREAVMTTIMDENGEKTGYAVVARMPARKFG
jgi:hypothetical protein